MIHNELRSVRPMENDAALMERVGDEYAAFDEHHAEACEHYEDSALLFDGIANKCFEQYQAAVAKADSVRAKAQALKEEGKSE